MLCALGCKERTMPFDMNNIQSRVLCYTLCFLSPFFWILVVSKLELPILYHLSFDSVSFIFRQFPSKIVRFVSFCISISFRPVFCTIINAISLFCIFFIRLLALFLFMYMSIILTKHFQIL